MENLIPAIKELSRAFEKYSQPSYSLLANITADANGTSTPLSAMLSSLGTLLSSPFYVLFFGGLFEVIRLQLLSRIYGSISNFLFISVTFVESDPSYEWVLFWLTQQPSWGDIRNAEINTGQKSQWDSPFYVIPGRHSEIFRKPLLRFFLRPSIWWTYRIWYRNRLTTISRHREKSGGFYEKWENTIHLSILSRDRTILHDILQEVRSEYMKSQDKSVCIYLPNQENNWYHTACRSQRSLRTVVLDPGVPDMLMKDAKEFLESKQWYNERGIPFRRGYLLYGAPGTGKTSIIHAMAGELGLDVYVVSLSKSGMDDTALNALIMSLPERCVALMEDIDAAFTQSTNRDDSKDSGPDKPSQLPRIASKPGVSLSGLLNALDGIGAQEGRILFATTNKYSALDPALRRPGRMDVHVEFKLASKYQAGELFKQFYRETTTENADKDKDSNPEKKSQDSPLIDLEQSEDPKDAEKVPEDNYDAAAIEELAKRFVEEIPDRECSMASLQGYLLTHKSSPAEAVEKLRAWLEKEGAERVPKEGTLFTPPSVDNSLSSAGVSPSTTSTLMSPMSIDGFLATDSSKRVQETAPGSAEKEATPAKEEATPAKEEAAPAKEETALTKEEQHR